MVGDAGEREVEVVPLGKEKGFLLGGEKCVNVLVARGVVVGERQVTAFGRVIPAAVNNSHLLRS